MFRSRQDWWWPSVDDEESARRAALQGVGAAIVCMVITAGFGIFGILGMGIDSVTDGALLGFVAYATFRMSRVAAVAGLIYYVCSRIYLLIVRPDMRAASLLGVLMLTIFALCFVNAVRGTYAYHRILRSTPMWRDALILGSVSAALVLLALAAVLVLVPVEEGPQFDFLAGIAVVGGALIPFAVLPLISPLRTTNGGERRQTGLMWVFSFAARTKATEKLQEGPRMRWFFPVDAADDALDAIRIAFQASAISASLQALGVSFLMWSSGRWSWAIVDPILVVVLSWALKTWQSRIAAIALLSLSADIGFLALAAVVGIPVARFTGSSVMLTLLLIPAALLMYASYKGVQGTFGYQRLRGVSIEIRHLLRLSLVTLLYVLLYSALYVVLAVVLGSARVISAYFSDEAVGLVWLGGIAAIVLAAGFRRLPGTKRLTVLGSAPVPPDAERSRGYIAKHWRGELSLAQSYWLNVFLLGMAVNFLSNTIEGSGIAQMDSLVAIQLTVGLVALSVPMSIWQWGGCWRAARNHIRRTGRTLGGVNK